MSNDTRLTTYDSIFTKVREASRDLVKVEVVTINKVLLALADEAEKQTAFILAENQKDLARMDIADPKYDRLKLTAERIKGIATDIRNVSRLDSPLGKTLDSKVTPNGLKISKISVPLGVIGIIYEARPNVTFDCFALCLKSGNACILKGSSDAKDSNLAIISIIKKVLADHQLNTSIGELLSVEREATQAMLTARGYVDLIIPRGSQNLINYVVENAKIPIIETGAGIVHTYLDEVADIAMAADIVNNAKTRRVSVCNSLDCLIVHKKQLANLPQVLEHLAKSNVVIHADELSMMILIGRYPKELLRVATKESYGTEFLSYQMSVKTVDSFDEALNHIFAYSSKHSEAIISNVPEHVERFLNEVDAAAVYANSSTAFTDGAQFGLGAEIGISTQKLHARGPMALAELTSYKWLVRGEGQIRS
jgi:glutamate-5-semialdehyde dehydrogenase